MQRNYTDEQYNRLYESLKKGFGSTIADSISWGVLDTLKKARAVLEIKGTL